MRKFATIIYQHFKYIAYEKTFTYIFHCIGKRG